VPTPVRFRIGRYVVAQGGALASDLGAISSEPFAAHNVRRLVCFLHGGGVDFPVMKHIALRAEHRGLV
jgi:hypothetical protein